MKTYKNFLENCNKSNNSKSNYISESVNISGNASVGTIIVNGSAEQRNFGEQFFADVVWNGQLHRLEMFSEEGYFPSREELTEKIQDRYPGAIVHQVYPTQQTNDQIKIGKTKRYHPSKLEWI